MVEKMMIYGENNDDDCGWGRFKCMRPPLWPDITPQQLPRLDKKEEIKCPCNISMAAQYIASAMAMQFWLQ